MKRRIDSNLYTRLAEARLFMASELSEPIDLEKMAAKACLSPFHFHRLFRKIFRLTPHQYLTRLRLEKAKLLLQENWPVEQVCIAVGFESVASFSLLFRKNAGRSPGKYREKHLRKLQAAASEPRQFIPGCFRAAWFKLEQNEINLASPEAG